MNPNANKSPVSVCQYCRDIGRVYTPCVPARYRTLRGFLAFGEPAMYQDKEVYELPREDYETLLELAKALTEGRCPRWVKIAKKYRRDMLAEWMNLKEQGGTVYEQEN